MNPIRAGVQASVASPKRNRLFKLPLPIIPMQQTHGLHNCLSGSLHCATVFVDKKPPALLPFFQMETRASVLLTKCDKAAGEESMQASKQTRQPTAPSTTLRLSVIGLFYLDLAVAGPSRVGIDWMDAPEGVDS